jgi:hypothetical protein
MKAEGYSARASKFSAGIYEANIEKCSKREPFEGFFSEMRHKNILCRKLFLYL